MISLNCTFRSEIHENLNCTRCQNDKVGPENIGVGDENKSEHRKYQSDEDIPDIGGFAGIAGCLHKLKSSEKQVSPDSLNYHCIY